MGKICYASIDTPKIYMINVHVGVDSLSAGNLIVADTVEDAIAGNFSVMKPTKPATANLGKTMAIVLSGGSFETLADGRRPAGNPDYGTAGYDYVTGDIAPCLLLQEGVSLWISDGAISGVSASGKFLEPVNASYVPTIKDTRTTGTLVAMQVIAKKAMQMGGLFGGEFEAGSFVRVVKPNNVVA